MTATTLILDGIWGRPARFGRLRRVLEATCGPTEIFHYNTSGCVPFEILARQLCERVRELDRPINLLGFSMGGIVIRTAHLLDPSMPIRRAVFLNTPHGGTVMSYLLPLGGTRQLQPTSSLMKKLAADDWDIPTLVTWCPLDTIIVPGRSANWARAAQSIRSAPLFHNWPIWSGKMHRTIAGFLSQQETTLFAIASSSLGKSKSGPTCLAGTNSKDGREEMKKRRNKEFQESEKCSNAL